MSSAKKTSCLDEIRTPRSFEYLESFKNCGFTVARSMTLRDKLAIRNFSKLSFSLSISFCINESAKFIILAYKSFGRGVGATFTY